MRHVDFHGLLFNPRPGDLIVSTGPPRRLVLEDDSVIVYIPTGTKVDW